MSLLKAIKAQLGLSNTATNNFTLTAEAADGTMKLARGNAGATTQDILTVDAAGKVSLPQGSGNLSYTSQVTPIPSAGGAYAYSHSLGVVPVEAQIELVCLTVDGGYAVGDIVTSTIFWTGTVATPQHNTWRSTTQVGFNIPAGYTFYLLNKTTNAQVTPTAASWALRFRLRTA